MLPFSFFLSVSGSHVAKFDLMLHFGPNLFFAEVDTESSRIIRFVVRFRGP